MRNSADSRVSVKSRAARSSLAASVLLPALLLLTTLAPAISNAAILDFLWPKAKTRENQRATVELDAQGNIVVDGRPFFPIGIFHVDTPEHLRMVKSAGFNTVETTADRAVELRDALERERVWVVAYGGGVETESVRATVELLRDQPMLLAYYPFDEPDLSEVPLAKARAAYQLFRKLDPHRPVFAVIARPNEYDRWKDTSDILGVDPYPIPHAPPVRVAEYMNSAVASISRRQGSEDNQRAPSGYRAVWGIPQAFDWDFYGEDSGLSKPKHLLRPTEAEMRLMTYLEVIHGAKGIIFYCLVGYRGFNTIENPIQWRALRRLARELARLSPALVGPDAPWKLEAKPPEGIHTRVKRWGDDILILAANSEDVAKDLTLQLLLPKERRQAAPQGATQPARPGPEAPRVGARPGLPDSAEVMFENRTVRLQKGAIADRFDAYDVHVYRLKMTE
jgi:hypothetical protein